MTVSIIIAAKTWQRNLEECVAKCLRLDYPDFEIIILPDEIFTLPFPARVPVQIIPTGPVNPARKRDTALNYATGQILAFLDDDAYPEPSWLKNAVKIFEESEKIAAVGGPAMTPDSDNLRQKISGLIYSSFLVSGNYTYRYVARKRREVDDYPSCNFLVRKSVMLELGGFDTDFWPGEDTKLCLGIAKKLHKKIVYDPQVLVYHHRREIFLPHLKQVANYALHRGYFAKKLPQTSLKLSYFIPSVFVFGILCGGIISLFSYFLNTLYLLGLVLYVFLVLLFSIPAGVRFIIPMFLGVFFTHIAYGIYFIKGLCVNKLKEES